MAYTITYVGGWIRVTGTDPGTNDVFGQIFDASVAGTWGIETQTKNYMQFSPTNGLINGDALQVSPTVISSQSERVVMLGNITSEGAVSFNTDITWGGYNSLEDKSSVGSTIWWISNQANDICANNVIFKAYDCNLYDVNIGGANYQWFRGNTTILDSLVTGGVAWRFTSPSSIIKRVDHLDGFYGFASEASGQTWEKVRINSCQYGYGGLAVGGEAANIEILNSASTNVVVAFAGTGNVDLLNSIFDIVNVTWIGGASSKVLRKRYTIDAKCIDDDGVGIQDVVIEMYSVGQSYLPPLGTPEFSVSTDINGEIPQQKITTGTNIFNNIYSNYNPYTVIVKKKGYEPKIFTETILNAKEWIFYMAGEGMEGGF